MVDSKGEFGLGQHELNVKYAEILEMADRHIVYKQVIIQLHLAYFLSVAIHLSTLSQVVLCDATM